MLCFPMTSLVQNHPKHQTQPNLNFGIMQRGVELPKLTKEIWLAPKTFHISCMTQLN